MTNKSKKRPTSSEKHLTDEEVVFCAQELILERYTESVPGHIQYHVGSCHNCYTSIQDFYQLISDEPALLRSISKEKDHTMAFPDPKKQAIPGSFIKNQYKPYRWLYAAAVIFLLAAATMYILHKSASTPEKLFAEYHTPYLDVITTKSIQDDHHLLNGLFYYNIGEYKQAIIYFNSGLSHSPDDQDLLFYLAGSYLAIGDYEQAIPIYKLLRNTSPKYQSPATWYLALSYLAGSKTGEAIEILHIIRDEDGFYAQDAGEILRKLK